MGAPGKWVTNGLHISGMREGCLEGGLKDFRLDEVRGKSRVDLKGNLLMGWILLGKVSFCPSAS